MISRPQIMKRLRDAGFTFDDRMKRTERWRKPGTDAYVMLPIRDLFTIEEASILLKQAKLSEPEVERFITGCVKEAN